MAQKDYGAAEPIVGIARKYEDIASKVREYKLPWQKSAKKDASWHEEMVKKANESFRKGSPKKPVAGPSRGTAKPFRSKSRRKNRPTGKLVAEKR